MARPVLFVDATPQIPSGSTLIRTYQLMQIATPALAGAGLQTAVTHHLQHRGAVLILNKNTLLTTPVKRLKKAQLSGNILVGDPLDSLIDRPQLGACDVLLASSFTQLDALRQMYPDKTVTYVAHHVDARLPRIDPPKDRLRLGYFGEAFNAAFSDDGEIPFTIVPVDTSMAANCAWMERLRDFNAHYVLRAKRSEDGYKPFTKGFIAAHCGCPALIGRQDAEARRLLPPDYPFVADAQDRKDAIAAIDQMREAFGGGEWNYAKEAMRMLLEGVSYPLVARQLLSAVESVARIPHKPRHVVGIAASIGRRILRRRFRGDR